eukprot:CAMPEP_0202693640 /NCGR_PEP_ID=MMETSP1385-20130828/7684_1 /ASSEMBLY_ACC=CAM_ASM_000861 /TAXON_ID=933848 /ORGANISM="Elphidium margaritaceum" /LENGTH=607 /DNA_ID=CAMNT_0049349337 /DNA_START=31 /DNA_END=1851 /DNA_ORIENTATION=+
MASTSTNDSGSGSFYNLHNVKRAMRLLNDEDLATAKRMECLRFLDECVSKSTQSNHVHSSNMNDAISILKCVVRRFVDRKEMLRSLSIDIVRKHIAAHFECVKYVVGIISHRVLSSSTAATESSSQEKSEEIRLKFVALIGDIVSAAKLSQEVRPPFVADLIAILLRLLGDEYEAIKCDVCTVLIALSHTFKLSLPSMSAAVIDQALHLLAHRRSRVQIAGITLVEYMLINGGHERIQTLTGFREQNVVPLKWWFGGEHRINYFGALCRHPKSSVRTAFYRMILKVMSDMPQRYDYKTLLLSYVLSGLQDDNESVQHMMFDGIERIGQTHQHNEYNQLKREIFFEQEAEQITKQHLADDDDDGHRALPLPFRHRPCLGARVLIREHFARVVHAAIAELSDWKHECRAMALLLLRNMMVYAEEHCTQHTELLLTALHAFICDDTNQALAHIAQQCCALIASNVYPLIWVHFLADIAQHEYDEHWLTMLCLLISHCPPKRLHLVSAHIINLMELLSNLQLVPKEHNNNNGNNSKQSQHVLVAKAVHKVRNVMQKYGDIDNCNVNHDGDADFVFSSMSDSEYDGFHLEIFDETTSAAQENATDSLQQRID